MLSSNFTPTLKVQNIKVSKNEIIILTHNISSYFSSGTSVQLVRISNPYHDNMVIKKVVFSQCVLYVIDTEGKLYKCKYSADRSTGLSLKLDSGFTDKVVDIVGTETHMFLLTKTRVFAMGNNNFGQLGLGHLERVGSFVPLTFFDRINMNSNKYRDRVVKIECSNTFTLFFTNTKKIYTCGSNYYGQQTFPEKSFYLSTPQRITVFKDNLDDVVDIYCGKTYSLFKLANGSYISYGQFYNPNSRSWIKTDLNNIKIVPNLQQFDSIETVYCLPEKMYFTTKFTKIIETQYNDRLICQSVDSEETLLFCNEKDTKNMHVLTNDGNFMLNIFKAEAKILSFNIGTDPYVRVYAKDEEVVLYYSDYSQHVEKSIYQLVSEKSKQFKLPSDTIEIGNSTSIYTFLAFIQFRNPSFYALLKQNDLINSENSPIIIQDLVDYCFSEDCSFMKRYSSPMIAELLYYMERMKAEYNDFTAPLIYWSSVHISNSEEFQLSADKFLNILKQEGITPNILGKSYLEYIENNSPVVLPSINSCLEKLFNSDSADTTIIIDQFGTEKIKCHRSVLIAQSTFFEAFYTGHFASDEINLFNDEDAHDGSMTVSFEEMSDEEKQLLIDPESQIKTRALKNILMMFYGIDPAVENDLVIPMLDIAHKLDSERLVLKCLQMFETSLDAESLQVINQWLSGVDEKTDVQNMILTSADTWSSEISQRNILFQNSELEQEFKDIGTLTHFQIDAKFSPSVTTHFVANHLDKEDYNFLCAVAGNCAIVKPEYIRKSIESQCWIDEEPYLFKHSSPELDSTVQTLLKVNQENKLLKKLVFAQFTCQVILRKNTKQKVECLIRSGGGKIDNFYATRVFINKKTFSNSKKIGGKCGTYIIIDYHHLVDILMGGQPHSYAIDDIYGLTEINLSEKKRKRESSDEVICLD